VVQPECLRSALVQLRQLRAEHASVSAVYFADFSLFRSSQLVKEVEESPGFEIRRFTNWELLEE